MVRDPEWQGPAAPDLASYATWRRTGLPLASVQEGDRLYDRDGALIPASDPRALTVLAEGGRVEQVFTAREVK